MTIEELISKLQKEHMPQMEMSQEEIGKLRAKSYNDAIGDLNERDGYNCSKCKNKGQIAEYRDGYEIHRLCECQKIRSVLAKAKRSGLGDCLREYRFDKFETKEEWQAGIKKKAMDFCEDENAKWFYIGGQPGSGKTFLCTAISAHYIKAGKELRYFMWAEDAKKLKAAVNNYEIYGDLIKEYKEADVLYIDDFLKVRSGEQPTAADINLAFELINHRLLSKDKVTIISSEKLIEDLIDYDEATMSRIYQNTGDYKISILPDRKKNYRLHT